MSGSQRSSQTAQEEHQFYEATWVQFYRIAERCNYWYTSVMSRHTREMHATMVKRDLNRIHDAIHKIGVKERQDFAHMVGDEVLDGIEGPRGLGTTKKSEMVQAMRKALFRLKIDTHDIGLDGLEILTDVENKVEKTGRR